MRGACPRPTCTCTSPGRCASTPCATSPRSTACRCPTPSLGDWPPRLARATDERGWFRFQRLYDAARACVRGEDDMRRIVREAAEDDAAEGSRWLEIQVDPTSYAPFVGGITPALEIVLDEARAVSAEGRIGVGVIVAASRMRHPLEARTLARLAARHAGDGRGRRRGLRAVQRRAPRPRRRLRARLRDRPSSRPRPRAARRRAARRPVGHGDPRAPGPRPDRPRGARASRTRRCSTPSPRPGVTLEVCPGSNVALGVYAEPGDVPLHPDRRRRHPGGARGRRPAPLRQPAGRPVRRWPATWAATDAVLADLARGSILASRAPEPVRSTALRDIDGWLADEPEKSALPV